jgi:predicted secreted hydrolase
MSEKSLRLRLNLRQKTLWLTLAGLVVLVLAAGLLLAPKPSAQVKGGLLALPPAQGNFARADAPRPLIFPLDMGPHPDFQTEWWYYTGNLSTSSGRQFGFELTFFRRALDSPDMQAQRSSDWATSQVYLAHFTLTDAAAGQFHAFERYERGAAGLAGAQAAPYHVWLQDWSISQTGPNQYHLHAAQEGPRAQSGFQLDLQLTDLKGPILEGDHGLSQKGPQPGNASYYYSQTRLQTTGTIQANGQAFSVSGLSWMDHEFSTSALGPDQVGWDWFSVQLADGSELMLYNIRQKDGSADPFSNGTIIYPDRTTRQLKAGDFKIQATSAWKSPHSGGTYPASWTVSIPSEKLVLQIKPLIPDQELNLSIIYWEGAVQISGEKNGVKVDGKGYVELTGYAQSLAGNF